MIISTPKYTIELRKDNIIHIDVVSNDRFSSDDFFSIIESIRQIRLNTSEYHPVIITVVEGMLPDKEVRDLISSKLFRKYLVAGAFVSTHMPHRLLVNTHLSIYKPHVPTRIFSKKNTALIWLQQFRNN